MNNSKRLIVSVTGASGAIYAVRFLRQAALVYDKIYLILSDNAAAVYTTETGKKLPVPYTLSDYLGEDATFDNIEILDSGSYFTPPASGSFVHHGMVVIPCSMGTLGRIANGISNDLTTRAADVCLKERRKLVLVARETPLNLIHLKNMVSATEAGAIVLPACPSFYNHPASIEDIIDTIVARVLQNLDVPQQILPQWQIENE
jgi:4-hydroxy-3-polyprenylbenzoate decarboxylase